MPYPVVSQPGNPFHFFLVQACDLQMPHSFAERLIWEDVQKSDSDFDAQFYFKSSGPERILIQGLPVTDADADETLHAFKSEFSRRPRSGSPVFYSQNGQDYVIGLVSAKTSSIGYLVPIARVR